MPAPPPVTRLRASTRVWRLVRSTGFLFAFDAAMWFVALPAALAARYEFEPTARHMRDGFELAAFAAILNVLFAIVVTMRNGRRQIGSFGEVLAMARAAAYTTLTIAIVNPSVEPRLVPLSVPFLAGPLALVLQVGLRGGMRFAVEARSRPDARTAKPVIVFGAGDAGTQLVTAMLRSPKSPYLPVAMLDDDPQKADLRIASVPVVGNREHMAEAAAAYGAEILVVAIASAHANLIRDLAARAGEAGLAVHVVPPVHVLIDGSVHLADVRPVSESDLLGRHEIDTDLRAIAGYITGRRVLVTGAGGSIGSELCRQVARFSPATLVMLDRDESALHALQLSLHGRASLDDPNVVLADIRDPSRVREVFQRALPDVVFHAAALKHLTMLEMHPEEAVKTNVVGTQNVIDAAVECGVRTFVNISTDKAANPTSVLGYSKRIAERLTAGVRVDGATYLSVRFGNVLGSRGSVLTVFRHQIEAGGPVTVTDPHVTRFFMTIEEAVQLVIQAGAIGSPGEALVLDMGEPVSIAEVAKRLIEASGRHVEIEFTGLKPGEKLHEELLGAGEGDDRPRHPQISHVVVPPLRMRDVWRVDERIDEVATRLADLSLCDLSELFSDKSHRLRS